MYHAVRLFQMSYQREGWKELAPGSTGRRFGLVKWKNACQHIK